MKEIDCLYSRKPGMCVVQNDVRRHNLLVKGYEVSKSLINNAQRRQIISEIRGLEGIISSACDNCPHKGIEPTIFSDGSS